EGYIDPAATARGERSTADGNYTVLIDIRPGAYFSYGGILIQGNRAMSDIEIRYRLYSETFRFIESEFKKNIIAIRKAYWGRGYPEADVRYTLNRDRANAVVDIGITVREGPKYRIAFSGNRRFWDITLRKSLALAERGNTGDAGARKSAQNITALYRTKGYPGARVKLDVRQSGDGEKERKALTFVIDEGPRVDVARLQVSGNASFSEKTIRGMMGTRESGKIITRIFDADVLENDLLVIRSWYLKKGFLDARVTSSVRMTPDKKRALIQVNIFEGAATTISSVSFNGNHVVPDEQLRKKIALAPGRPYQEADVTAAENLISSLISAQGYPYVEVKGTAAISPDRSKTDIVFRINEGKQVRLGTVNFSGNMRTRTSYLRKQLSLKPGDPVSIQQVLDEYKNISDIDIFQAVNLTTFGIEEKRERADLFIDVMEKKTFLLGIGGGYNSEKGLYAHTSFEDRNFLGRYKSAWVKGEIAETGYSASAGLTEPRLIGNRASATVSFSIDREKEFNQTFGTFTYGPACSIKSVWFDSLTAGLGLSYQERKMTGYFSASDYTDPDKTGQFHLRRILLFSAALNYDRRDSFIRPRKGFLTSLMVDVSVDLNRPKKQLFSHEYSDNFIKYQYGLKFYVTPWSRLTFAAHAMLGFIQPYTGVKGIISDQLFYLGGIGDVRGFKENMLKHDEFNNPVGGRASVAASIEARLDLGFNFELSGFFDAGRIDNCFYDFYRMRMSAGAGLRYMTPVGPIGLLYGFKINRLKSEDLGMLHISIGYTF
ncbi:MAG TPA: outer membrane protein assembly factor BamA, partial [Spirochaetota bacterium]|nr:outer membrane protein assembly factor BamA [Spirochaetota bacterium]